MIFQCSMIDWCFRMREQPREDTRRTQNRDFHLMQQMPSSHLTHRYPHPTSPIGILIPPHPQVPSSHLTHRYPYPTSPTGTVPLSHLTHRYPHPTSPTGTLIPPHPQVSLSHLTHRYPIPKCNVFCKHYPFSPLNTFMRKGEEPDPYF
jgi:hypothetical protein